MRGGCHTSTGCGLTSSEVRSALRAAGERELRRGEVESLLRVDEDESVEVAARAGELARERFSDGVFVYGFVYFSTFCDNECTFCYNRKGNENAFRYRKSVDEVTEAVKQLINDGVHCVDLTSGEDSYLAGGGWDALQVPVKTAASAGAAVMASPGVVDGDVLRKMSDWGVDWYALYQESYEPDLYSRMRQGQPAQGRVRAREVARGNGMLTEDGLLTGVGETTAGFAGGVLAMCTSQQVRAMGFLPQPGTVHPGATPPLWREVLVTAVLRLCHPDSLVPATLDSAGSGFAKRLDAGANVVTSCIPPGLGLRGVAQPTRGIEDGSRSVPSVLKAIREAGYTTPSRGDYRRWLEENRPG